MFRKQKGENIISKYRKVAQNETSIYNTVPTFKEFIDYIVDTPVDQYDRHWMPTYFVCHPCSIKYDIIAKTENMEEDSQIILKNLELNTVLTKTRVTHGEKSESKAKEYYSVIDLETMKKLYAIYEVDFILFGYSADEYFEYAVQK